MVKGVIAYQKVTSDFFEYSRTDSEYCGKSDTEMTCTKIIKPQITIVGTNGINGNNCNYGGLCSIYVKKKDNDNVYNNKFKDSRTFMINCEIDEYSHKLHEVSQTIFYHWKKDKDNLKNKKYQCCLFHTNKVDDNKETKRYNDADINTTWWCTKYSGILC